MTTQFFDAAYYLQSNSDVMADPYYKNHPEEHYQAHGRFERRDPNGFFSESSYLQLNADVTAPVTAGTLSSGYDHWIQFGQFEGRSPGLDIGYKTAGGYLSANPDVAAAVGTGTFRSAWEHYAQYGHTESRSSDGAYLFNGSGGNDSFQVMTLSPFVLKGGGGNDSLSGVSWRSGGRYFFGYDDDIQGGDGDDTLAGGPGNDTLLGGAGADQFVLSLPANAPGGTDQDVILDFTPGVDTLVILNKTLADLTVADSALGMTLSYTNTDFIGTATERILLANVHSYSSDWLAFR